MTGLKIAVTIAGAGLIALLAWYFFGSRTAQAAELQGGVQQVEIAVKGAYVPNLIRVRQGVPLRLVFDRQENSDCTSRVVFPDFGVSKSLAAFGKTAVDLLPKTAGEFGFACGMNMVHGTLIVEPASGGRSKQTITVRQGIDADHARAIVKLIKDKKLKVQAQIQDDQLRVSGKKRDDLQTVIQTLKAEDLDLPLQFTNMRE